MSRTLLLTSSFPRHAGDAAGHFVAAEVRQLCREGQRVRVLAAGRPESPAPAEPTPYRLEWLGGESLFRSPGALSRLRQNPWRLFALIATLRRAQRELSRAEESTFIVHWLLPFAFCAWLERRRRAVKPRLLLVAHGSDVRLLSGWLRPWAALWLGALQKSEAELRLVSRELLDELLALPRLSPATRAWLGRSQVEPARIELEPLAARSELRSRLGVAAEARLLLVMARLVPSKRVAVALSSALLVPEAQIVVLGDGPERATLERNFPSVRFLGELPRPLALAWLGAADLLVSASRTEGAPTAVREARHLGIPVVSPAVGDTRAWAALDRELWLLDAPAKGAAP